MRQWESAWTKKQRMILNISASPFWRGKREVRRSMLAALAKRHGAYVVMVNQVGGNDSLVFDGSSMVLDRMARWLRRQSRLPRIWWWWTRGRRPQPVSTVEDADGVRSTWDALVLGTRDYVRKCGFRKVLVGLSGGIDSALVAAIAVEALGAENVVGVGMPSEYSSLGSIEDAKRLAKNLGIRFEMLPIHDVFAEYLQVLKPLFAGTPFGLAEENLQSRIRGALLMALSNKFGALVHDDG